jgi:hypothetical protein
MRRRYERWTVLQFPTPLGKHPRVLARCRCGVIRKVGLDDLRSGRSRSCGCLRRELLRTHGESGRRVGIQRQERSAEYSRWLAMHDRCRNSRHPQYHHYGGRGIRVCRRWQSFANFLADMGRRPPGTTLERRKNNRGYTPRNCYWATTAQQARNRRTTRWLCYLGVRLPLQDWAQRLGLHPATLHSRLGYGWPKRDVFSPRKFNRWNRRRSSNSAS